MKKHQSPLTGKETNATTGVKRKYKKANRAQTSAVQRVVVPTTLYFDESQWHRSIVR